MNNWSLTSPLITGLQALRAREGFPSFDDWSIAELLRGERLAPSRFKDGASHGRTFDRDQPRVPAGHSDGGQWTREGGSGARISDTRSLSDITPDNHWISGAQYAGDGHHYVPRATWRDLPLLPETKRVFDKALSGPIPLRTYNNPITREVVHVHQWNKPHVIYNHAVTELMEGYMKRNSIAAERMTPVQAQDIVRVIRESRDPRIRDFNAMIGILRRLYRARTGARGGE